MKLPCVPEWAEPVWHLFAVCHRQRDKLQAALSAAGIGTLIHYPVPPHLSGAYADAGWKAGDFPVAEEIAKTELSLPMGPHLGAKEQEIAIQALRQTFLANNPKTRGRPLEIFSNAFLRVKYFVLTKISEVLHKRRYRNFRPSYDSDAVVHGIDRYVASLTRYLERGNIEMFLKRLAELTVELLPAPLEGRALFAPELDELTHKASRTICACAPPGLVMDSKCLVHVATRVYSTGGHTRVIGT